MILDAEHQETRAYNPKLNATTRALCRIYKLPEGCWRKPYTAAAIRRLPEMKPEGRKYMLSLIRRGWNEKTAG